MCRLSLVVIDMHVTFGSLRSYLREPPHLSNGTWFIPTSLLHRVGNGKVHFVQLKRSCGGCPLFETTLVYYMICIALNCNCSL
jgi:hypothetical protein